jgi:hypothetical protein
MGILLGRTQDMLVGTIVCNDVTHQWSLSGITVQLQPLAVVPLSLETLVHDIPDTEMYLSLPIGLVVVDRFIRHAIQKRANHPMRLANQWDNLHFLGLQFLGRALQTIPHKRWVVCAVVGNSPWDGGMFLFLFHHHDIW